MTSFYHGVELVELDTGAHPITTVASSIIGLVGSAPNADAAKFPPHTPVLITNKSDAVGLDPTALGGGTLQPAALDALGQGASAIVVIVAAPTAPATSAVLADIVGGVDTNGNRTGMQALLDSQATLGLTPRLLAAPGWTGTATGVSGGLVPSAAATALVTLAGQLRGIAVIDGPNTTGTDAIEVATAIGSPRAYLVDPEIDTFDLSGASATDPASAAVCGLIAASDAERGFWWSPSNYTFRSVTGTSRPIDYQPGEKASRANTLNAGNVATIINQGGYRLWGNRTCALAASDPNWVFLAVRRTADMIELSIQKAHQWAVDRPIGSAYVQEVTKGIKAYLRSLRARGAIIDGTAWADPAMNTPNVIASGEIYFDFDFEPPPPAERVIFRSHLNNGYLSEVFKS